MVGHRALDAKTGVQIPVSQPKLMINDKLKEIIQSYQALPNAPFSQKHISAYVRNFLKSTGFEFDENDHFIIVKPTSTDKTKRNLLLMAHLDHPGMVLKNRHEGVVLGLKNTTQIIKYLETHPIKIRLFDPKGNSIGKADVKRIIPGPRQEVEINSDFDIPRNSIGMLDVESYEENESILKLYNADDGIMVCILLYLLKEKMLGDAYNTHVAFMKHEEVHQVSSWKFAKLNPLKLTDSDLILNLECAKTRSIDEEKYGVIDYDSGIVLQLSTGDCLLGYKNPGPNLVELAIKSIAQRGGIELQIGAVGDSCDSRPLTQFALTPNICTLTIPNKYKHDGADDGMIRPEEIHTKDVATALQVLTSFSNTPIDFGNPELGASLSEKLKAEKAITNEASLQNKWVLNERLAIAYRSVVTRGYYYPESLLDHAQDFIYKLLSYAYYYAKGI